MSFERALNFVRNSTVEELQRSIDEGDFDANITDELRRGLIMRDLPYEKYKVLVSPSNALEGVTNALGGRKSCRVEALNNNNYFDITGQMPNLLKYLDDKSNPKLTIDCSVKNDQGVPFIAYVRHADIFEQNLINFNINDVDECGKTILHHIFKNTLSKKLLDKISTMRDSFGNKADLSIKDRFNKTAIDYLTTDSRKYFLGLLTTLSTSNTSIGSTKDIIEKKATVYSYSETLAIINTFAYLSTSNTSIGSDGVLKMLFKKGTLDANVKNDDGFTLLSNKSVSYPLFKILLASGANITELTKKGYFMEIYHLTQYLEDVSNPFLTIDCSIKNIKGASFICTANTGRDLEAYLNQNLINFDINAQSIVGEYTLLHYACLKQPTENLIKRLLNLEDSYGKRADLSLRDDEGRTAFECLSLKTCGTEANLCAIRDVFKEHDKDEEISKLKALLEATILEKDAKISALTDNISELTDSGNILSEKLTRVRALLFSSPFKITFG